MDTYAFLIIPLYIYFSILYSVLRSEKHEMLVGCILSEFRELENTRHVAIRPSFFHWPWTKSPLVHDVIRRRVTVMTLGNHQLQIKKYHKRIFSKFERNVTNLFFLFFFREEQLKGRKIIFILSKTIFLVFINV